MTASLMDLVFTVFSLKGIEQYWCWSIRNIENRMIEYVTQGSRSELRFSATENWAARVSLMSPMKSETFMPQASVTIRLPKATLRFYVYEGFEAR